MCGGTLYAESEGVCAGVHYVQTVRGGMCSGHLNSACAGPLERLQRRHQRGTVLWGCLWRQGRRRGRRGGRGRCWLILVSVFLPLPAAPIPTAAAPGAADNDDIPGGSRALVAPAPTRVLLPSASIAIGRASGALGYRGAGGGILKRWPARQLRGGGGGGGGGNGG